ncbi:MAG: SBBP repeat-containing protein [Bryobacteraceae bacterium]
MHGSSVRLKPVGANASTPPTPIGQQSSKSNYFIGNIPERWHTGIPDYAKVRYENVYQGVDLIYYGNQRELEYDFVVNPGADPGNISVQFEGPSKAELDREGDVVMNTTAGKLRWHKPIAYQEVNGRRKLVDCAYLPSGSGLLRFSVGAYDRAKALVIDPVLAYSTYVGGSDIDGAAAVAVDAHGSAYVTGFTTSSDFPTKNAFQSSNHAPDVGGNAFIAKFDAAGNLVYSTYLGGSSNGIGLADSGSAITVDAHGQAYVTGIAGSADFPIKNAFQPTNHGAVGNAFVTKLSAAGDALIYSTYLGGNNGECDPNNEGCTDVGSGIAVDSHGSAYIAGSTVSPDFPTKNAFQDHLGFQDQLTAVIPSAFVTKLCPAGNALVYSTYLAGSGGEQANGIAVDPRGQAYVTGSTRSTDFPTKNAFQNALGSSFGNAFITKFDADGGALVYSTYLGGSGGDFPNGDSGQGIAVNARGEAYVTGTTHSTNFPIKNAFQNSLGSSFGNAFVTKFHANGDALVYSTYLGGSGEPDNFGDQATGIALGKQGEAYVTGSTGSADFPTKDAFQPVYGGAVDGFITKLCPVGTLVYSSYLGGTAGDFSAGIAVDYAGDAYVTGRTASLNFPTKDAFQPAFQGVTDAFVTKISAH